MCSASTTPAHMRPAEHMSLHMLKPPCARGASTWYSGYCLRKRVFKNEENSRAYIPYGRSVITSGRIEELICTVSCCTGGGAGPSEPGERGEAARHGHAQARGPCPDGRPVRALPHQLPPEALLCAEGPAAGRPVMTPYCPAAY